MRIGVPKEIKNFENRVGVTPAGVRELRKQGHEVWVETGAGLGSGLKDSDYQEAGAHLKETAQEVWSADMVCKVKEPLEPEFAYFREDLLLFTYLHLAAEAPLTKALLEAKVTAIAYETVQLNNHSLPLLTPMSEVAGRMSVQIGAHFLEKAHGGQGILLGGVPGVHPGKVVIVGGGVAGVNAAKMALGLGARVSILDINAERLRQLDDLFHGQVETIMSNEVNLAGAVETADLLIGAVLIPGTKAPKLVSEAMVKSMKDGSVIVDIAIDQGGCIATVDRVTSHSDPVYEKYGVIHYSVGNMPGAVPRTSTFALTNVTLPYALKLAKNGYKMACHSDGALTKGLNTCQGHVTHEGVAQSLGYTFVKPETLLN
ncbi:MAG: alanine dehydrogenase [Trueperaceae bacterium]|nr:alanine dehydrogenase [Trueperaceae bacterium]